MSLDAALRTAVQAAIKSGEETRYSIAKVADVDYRSLARWLDEDRDIRLSTAGKLADHLGLTLAAKKGKAKS